MERSAGPMRFIFFGLSIASAWGSGHATTYRGLIRELAARGHVVVFYERRTEWFDNNCDLPYADYCDIRRYETWPPADVEAAVADADVVVLGSYAADGIAIADWLSRNSRALLAYYDIDTPVTLERLGAGEETAYLLARQLAVFDVVFSFSGGPALDALRRLGARRAEPLYCAVDGALYHPTTPDPRFACDLGYMGTSAAARQDLVDELFLAPARLRPAHRFVLAGAQYPADIEWPQNVTRFEHVVPADHPSYYASCAWQAKVHRIQMRRAGWSPSVTLFEAAACGAPLISDSWPGFGDFLEPGREALLASSRADVLAAFDLHEQDRRRLGAAARRRVLAEHTYVQRVDSLERVLHDLGATSSPRSDGNGEDERQTPAPATVPAAVPVVAAGERGAR